MVSAKEVACALGYLVLLVAGIAAIVEGSIGLSTRFDYNSIGRIDEILECSTPTVTGSTFSPYGQLDVSFIPTLENYVGLMNMTISMPPTCQDAFNPCCEAWLDEEIYFDIYCSNETQSCIVLDLSAGVIQHRDEHIAFLAVGLIGTIGLVTPLVVICIRSLCGHADYEAF